MKCKNRLIQDTWNIVFSIDIEEEEIITIALAWLSSM